MPRRFENADVEPRRRERIAVVQKHVRLDRLLRDAYQFRKTRLAASQSVGVRFGDIDRCAGRFFQSGDAEQMIEMPVRNEDIGKAPAVFFENRKRKIGVRRIDDRDVLCAVASDKDHICRNRTAGTTE